MSDLMKKTTYYSACENCEAEVEGVGEYSQEEGTLYGEKCAKCGEEFIVIGWFDKCDFCELYHYQDEKC